MRSRYQVHFAESDDRSKRAIEQLVAGYASVQVISPPGTFTSSYDEAASRELFDEACRLGFTCSFKVPRGYLIEDALCGELGILHGGGLNDGAKFAKDTFDFSTGCPHCGLGAAQVKPTILPVRSKRYKGNFADGAEWSAIVLLRSEIGQEIIDATGQPWCMRHPVLRSGEVVEDWMEPIPCATMPPLSRKSKGVMFGCTTQGGEPAEVKEPCPVCGRTIWDYDRSDYMRLMYPKAAIEAAQQHAVVAMYEPWHAFPEFDPIKRTCKDPIGLPWLLFSRKAIEVLVKYVKMEEDVRKNSFIEPVFAEE
jgi:hypothetical protein